jgi:hypothetical protein
MYSQCKNCIFIDDCESEKQCILEYISKNKIKQKPKKKLKKIKREE